MPSENPDALDRVLQGPRMVRGPEEYIYLLQLRDAGKPAQARRFLENRAKEIVRFWTNGLGLNAKRGRPRNAALRLLYLYGARLRRQDPHRYSWAVLARMLDRAGFAVNPKQSSDRVRQGIETFLRPRRTR